MDVSPVDPPQDPAAPSPEPDETWTIRDLEWGMVLQNRRLRLDWELRDATYFSENWVPAEIDAAGLLRLWAARVGRDGDVLTIVWWVVMERRFGRQLVVDRWPVRRPPAVLGRPSFSDVFSVPVSERTGDVVDWHRVPVLDKRWVRDRVDPGGFIQEATGWKPTALQPSVRLTTLIDPVAGPAPTEGA
ncbi:MAG: hypothetical protein S0880_08450 [Actinomycetota bacterium]|nr:hypothetical protein [Actinomycetota bacterium]